MHSNPNIEKRKRKGISAKIVTKPKESKLQSNKQAIEPKSTQNELKDSNL